MSGDSDNYECARCGATFSKTADHTEIVRRDFVGVPQPSQVERLCGECWIAYVTDFLDEPLDRAADRIPSE